ncbi:MAG: hypothetical protein ACRDVL_00760 [Acidimicrobiia bacterium]
MVSQVCEHCGARVAADEQFCPECGGFIDPLAGRRSSGAGNVISVTSDGPYEEFSLGSEPPSEARREGSPKGNRSSRVVPCPSCGAENPPQNRHCQECGARLQQGPLPTAPRPAVQATAGVRAALGISGLLFLVILVALFFNLFNGDDSVAADTTIDVTATTTPDAVEPAPIAILTAECTPEGISSFTCSNLYSGTEAEYQVDWEELEAAQETVTIRLLFSQPMIVTQIVWGNIADETRFSQNFRARGITINAQGSLSPVPEELEDLPGQQNVSYAALNANWIEITVESAYRAQVVNDNVFGELAIDEITVIGRPANPVTNTTSG